MAVDSASKYSTLSAANATLEIPLGGFGSIGFQIGGTWTGTITFEGTIDHGTWQTLNVAKTNSTTQVTSTTANGVWVGSVAGLRAARARMSSYGSGTAQVQVLVAGASAAGSSAGGGGGGDVNLTEVGGAAIALGQALMAASLPVVIASNQAAIPVSGTVTATNASVSATGAAVPASATYVGVLDPSGNLVGIATEALDYATGGTTRPQVGFGVFVPGAVGPTGVEGGSGTAAGALRVELPTDGTGVIATVGAVTAITNALPAGTNNIGDVDVLSLPATPAGTNLIGRVSASDETSTIYDGTTALTPKFAIIDAATSGDNTLIAAVNPKKLRVLAGLLVSSGTVTVRFESGASGTALTGQINLIANTGFQIPYVPVGNFETASNTLLNLELSAAVSVDGWLVYIEV